MNIPKSQWPSHALEVLHAIRVHTKTARRGPTLSYLRCVCRGHPKDAERGLSWLKRRRLVNWTPNGGGTRYEERTR